MKQFQKELLAGQLRKNFPGLPYRKASELGFNKVYAEVNPRLSPRDLALQKYDLQKNGVLQPLVINKKGDVLDGYNRLENALALGDIPVPVITIDCGSPEKELLFVKTVNIIRRQMTTAERAIALSKVFPGYFTAKRLENSDLSDEIAKAIGIKPNVLKKARTLYVHAKKLGHEEGYSAPTRAHIAKAEKLEAESRSRYNADFRSKESIAAINKLTAHVSGGKHTKATFNYVVHLAGPVATLHKEIQKRIKKGK